MKKKFRILLPLLLLLATVASVTVVTYMWDNRLDGFRKDVDLYVYPSTTVEEVAGILIADGGARHPGRVLKVLREHGVASNMKPGHYVVEASRPVVYVARMLNNGWQTPVRLTLSGSLRRRDDIARKISSQILADSATVMAALQDRELLASLGTTPETVFSIMMPDTYEVYWTDSVESVLRRMKSAVDRFWTEENVNLARRLGLSRLEVATLASIVGGETNYVPEMNLIAGVYLNRLAKGMKLQADPTVAFCYDYRERRILGRMLKVDSPYNTYKHHGLPPAPICVPSRNTLNAVLNADRSGGYLYFCADPSFDGSHRFARSFVEHRRNARAYQKALDKRNIN